MNKRLVWNFEIDTSTRLHLPSSGSMVKHANHWEARFFWPDDQIIRLSGLDESFLALSQYKIKHLEDSYFLLADNDYNLKLRREELIYKPIVMKTEHAVAFGKKLHLSEQSPEMQLPACEEKNVRALIERTKKEGKKVKVEKEALIYKFNIKPSAKLELAWLKVAHKAYYSVSIESYSAQLVEVLTRQLLGDLSTSDYVSFLKNL